MKLTIRDRTLKNNVMVTAVIKKKDSDVLSEGRYIIPGEKVINRWKDCTVKQLYVMQQNGAVIQTKVEIAGQPFWFYTEIEEN